MPRGDGTGPVNGNAGRGRGAGRDAGPGGYCVCPECQTKTIHTVAEPCNKTKCPKCNAKMTRD